MTSQSPSTRKQCDFTKLMMAGYDLQLNNGSTQDFQVSFHGPRNTAYENGVWLVHVTLPDDYPFASPSIGFVNKMLHPNIDEASGSVCLDVINQTWTPLYSQFYSIRGVSPRIVLHAIMQMKYATYSAMVCAGLVNVFEVFLPQLLTYPNPTDPLNGDAASLFMHDKKKYDERVKEHVRLYASREEWERKKEKGEADADFDGIFSPLSEFSNVDNSDDIEILDIDDL
ncbi:ubiquitin-conjugating enzyme subfamily protein [Cardiosporidium cionae]|uniref:Ubiquitin-conjugating enzyme subfamily protein n=1 Tax=Cardiosporidium cionae TaxID=476202 RepID=A0ABQ7J6K5_9APIC|nr:ubiquitin-conjugating enzyme subfamily protein [Cardiosporidium cionae]|eukprot:KAF8819632.1 ubiquitin-conjugating enzyme subfamily protein [Cardiosporidium cionae]